MIRENLELVAPWLGSGVAPGTLPFPVLIDVKSAPGKFPNLTALQKRLAASAPHAVLDDGRQRSKGIATVPRRGVWIAALLLGCCFLAFVVSFALLPAPG